MQVQVKNGIVYEGVLKTFSPKVGFHVSTLIYVCVLS